MGDTTSSPRSDSGRRKALLRKRHTNVSTTAWTTQLTVREIQRRPHWYRRPSPGPPAVAALLRGPFAPLMRLPASCSPSVGSDLGGCFTLASIECDLSRCSPSLVVVGTLDRVLGGPCQPECRQRTFSGFKFVLRFYS